MPIPTLIHPIDVTVERLARDNLLMDDDAREPYHGVRTTSSKTVVVPAQVRWSDHDQPVPSEGGVRETERGFITVRVVDMDSIMGKGERLKRGDRITKIGSMEDLDLYITGQLPLGHWPDQNGVTMLRYRFVDRHPVSQSGDL